MNCRYAEETGETRIRVFSQGGINTYFGCKCGLNRCCNPVRLPESVRPIDVAGIHSSIVYNKSGELVTDYIIVKRKYCRKGYCKSFTQTEE